MCADRENCFVVAGLWREPGQIFRITDPLSHLPKHIEKVKWNTNPRAFLFLHFLLLMWNVNTDPGSVTVDTTKIFLMQVLGTAFASTEMMWGHVAASHLMCQTFPAILPLFHRGQNSDTNHNNRFWGRCLGGISYPQLQEHCCASPSPSPGVHHRCALAIRSNSGQLAQGEPQQQCQQGSEQVLGLLLVQGTGDSLFSVSEMSFVAQRCWVCHLYCCELLILCCCSVEMLEFKKEVLEGAV